MTIRISKKTPIILAGIIVFMILAVIAAPRIKAAAAQDAPQQLVDVSANEAETVAVAEDASADATGSKALAAAIAIGLAAAAGSIAMGLSISKAAEGISRQPEASGKIQGMLMLGLVFIETAIIYALVVAILIVFVM